MRICAAQLVLEAGNIERNLRKHVALVHVAISYRSDLIYFPELSLTGYEPKLAKDLAFDVEDRRLDVVKELAAQNSVAIGVGAPICTRAGICIAMIVFQPRRAPSIYAKQWLHSDELPFFVKGERQLILSMSDHALAPAICFESLQPRHAEEAIRCGADVYLASVAKSQPNVTNAYKHYRQIAKVHSMPVLMANSVGPSDDFVSAGQSAAWNRLGQLVAKMDAGTEGFVLFDTLTQNGRAVSV